MKKLSIAFVVLSLFSSASFGAGEVSARRAAGDMATEFKNYRYEPSRNPSPLPRREPQGDEKYIVEKAQQLASNNPLLSIILVDHGQIIFESYNRPARQDRPNFSWSMSKSLTAYTLGLENCETNKIDYDSPAGKYSSELKGTVYGEASVRNLLTMSSGVRKAISSGDHFVTNNCSPGIDCDGWQLQRSQLMSGSEYIQRTNERDIPSGKEFRYSATDTLALASILNQNGGLIEKFNQHIWSKIGAEGAGYWLLDKDNKPVAQAGFSATTRDWARLAMYSIKLLKHGNQCQQQFMKEATSKQLPNSSGRVGKAFESYGYQTWITRYHGKPAYWWVGYGGQRVAVDPESEKIMVITSWKEDYMREVYSLFKDWTR